MKNYTKEWGFHMNDEIEKGYVQVYTGNGKGKTTAAIGLTVRALGAGKRVYFGQFMKHGDYSEIDIIKGRFPEIELEQYGGDCVIGRDTDGTDREIAEEGYNKAFNAVKSGKYDLVVLDEINVVIYLKMLSVEQALELVNNKPEHTELVLTGRYADEEIIKVADLVTKMDEIKHYFNDGVFARKGIEM